MSEIVVKRRRLHAGQERVKGDAARFRIAMFGRRWGKNVLAIDEAQQAALAGESVGWFEPTYKYLLEAWRELVSRLRPVAKSVSDQDKRLELITGGVIEAWTCDTPDPARSRAYDLVIVNEAGLIRGLTEMWQAAIRPTLTDRAGRALFLGTPKGRSHDFSVLHAQADSTPGWKPFRGPTAENPFIPTEELEAAKAELPPQVYAQEYEGIPADDGGNPFGIDNIRACTIRDPADIAAFEKLTPKAFGWDFARSHDFTVGIGLGDHYEVCRFHRWQAVPWGEQKARIREKNGATPAWGDATRSRVDDVIVQDLQRMGTPMIPVPFSAPMKQALMQRLAVCIHERKLKIPDGPIVRELETFQYEYTSHGVRYEAPQGMYDDCVMALGLAVYGRDQFGELPDTTPKPLYEPDKHPGFDADKRERRKPWQEGWKPDAIPEAFVPSEELEPLGW